MLDELGDPATTADLLKRQCGGFNMMNKVAGLAALLELPGGHIQRFPAFRWPFLVTPCFPMRRH